MKILQIHKYYSRKRGGGSVTAFFETKKLLEEKGHQVIVFSMKDETNESSSYEKYFVEHFDLNKLNFFQKLAKIPKIIYNKEAQEKLQELINREKPEIAHIHNIYHYITPAIFHTLKENNIPIVYKLSDYKAICPNYKLFNKGQICEKCKGKKYYHCFPNRCIKKSLAFSFVGMLEAYAHNFKKSYEQIDLFLAPSDFMKNKCIEFGISSEKIKVLRNTMAVKNLKLKQEPKEKNYFLYLGRLSEEKGVDRLIKAVSILKKNTHFPPKADFKNSNFLYIAGRGPEEKRLKKLAKELNLEYEIKFLGGIYDFKRNQIIANAKFVVLPSIWYDNSPNVISEAGLLGRPLIVSDRGGSKEMVLNKESGLIYKADSVRELTEKIHFMLELDSEERKQMGEKQKKFIEKINDQENYYNNLMEIYQNLLSKKE